MDDSKDFQLRYVGKRFDGTRLPVDILADLPAFRDLLVAFAKDEWRKLNSNYVRVPRGFDKSLSFDLVALEPGSAMPKLNWRKESTQVNLPGFSDQIETIVQDSYMDIVKLIDNAANSIFPESLSSEHIRALNKFGSRLKDGERIEFLGSSDTNGNVVYFDAPRRKDLITHVRETYEAKFEGVGKLLGSQVADSVGSITIRTEQHGDISLNLDPERIISEFDGNINSDVQFDLTIELDHNNKLRSVIEIFDVELIDSISPAQRKLLDRLEHLASLEKGWMDGMGERLSATAIETAGYFITITPLTADAYKIYPSETGGILIELEWDDWDYSVEIQPDGSVEMYGISLSDTQEITPMSFESIDSSFLQEFSSRTRT
ncbi:hypothetical protein [Phytopseudomonas punonensis]|uniref:Uncharacterized protein n=1 Tax=Phytopseudomonas punonensis TaxID=1220495 RepID=A0A1M7NQJ0_9GAMM|nr:hypothetical protein [Pseudomonas punonensis]SHN06364.1 hypothetical protein SAMN05216288_0434 [Pseudomonas punonensis]